MFLPLGFYVTRIVAGEDPIDAGVAAINLARAEPEFLQIATLYGRVPDLTIYEVDAAPDSGRDEVTRSGHTLWEDE